MNIAIVEFGSTSVQLHCKKAKRPKTATAHIRFTKWVQKSAMWPPTFKSSQVAKCRMLLCCVKEFLRKVIGPLLAGKAGLLARLACQTQEVVSGSYCDSAVCRKRRHRCSDCKSYRQNGCLQRKNRYVWPECGHWAAGKEIAGTGILTIGCLLLACSQT